MFFTSSTRTTRIALVSAVLLTSAPAFAETVSTGFEAAEGYALGTINNQPGPTNPWWMEHPEIAFEQGVSAGAAHSGTQSFYWNNRVTNGTVAAIVSPMTLAPAGETGASAERTPTGGTAAPAPGSTQFTQDFWLRTASLTADPGLSLSISATTGFEKRVNYLRVQGTGGTLSIVADGYDATDPDVNVHDFTEEVVASNLTWGDWYHIKVVSTFLDGPGNDVVQIYLGTAATLTGADLKLTTNTWEDYYRDYRAGEALPAANSMLFRIAGTPDGGADPIGLYIDDLSLTSGAVPVPEPASLAVVALAAPALLLRRRATVGARVR